MAEVAAGAAVAAALIQAKTTVWDPLMQTIESSNDMDEISGKLDEAMLMLFAKRDDHENMVQRHRTTMMPSNIYNNWNHRVQEAENEAKNLQIKYTKERKKSSKFSFLSRSRFTNKMKNAALRFIALLKEGTDMVNILVDKKPACVVEMTTPSITNIPTLHKLLKKILDWLGNDMVRGVRIHGLVGSGKTTIMQNLNNHAKVSEMFDMVIWVTVSREGSMKNKGIDKIQQDIVQRLKLDIKATTHSDQIATRIEEELKNIKYLLLLDDVKENLDLQRIGVPIGRNNSKIVFTTRFQHVCSSIASRQTNVPKLDEREALHMFKTVLNRPDHEKDSNIKQLMLKIVQWCGYHPLMIKVAAGVFRLKGNEERWNDGYENLRKWPDKGDDNMQEIYKLLKCCFDFLEVTQKKCFFYSVLYPEDSLIQKDCLLDNWAAEKLLGTVNDVKEKGIKGRDMLDDLKMLSLIEENATQQFIQIHKLIRLAALHSLSTDGDQGILVKSGEALETFVNAECWKDKRWISLGDSEMNALPAQPDCQALSTLFLRKNPKLEVIPLAFFENMGDLRVLDLYDTRITLLPSSLLNLVTLKVLYLKKCEALAELPPDIGKLRELEVLDIRDSGLANIPPQVTGLICLRRLLVSFTMSTSTSIQNAANDFEVISKLRMLKELVINVKEGLEITLYERIVNAVWLTSLSLLQFCFPQKVVDFIKVVGDIWKISFPNERLLQSYIGRFKSFGPKKCQFFIGCDISSPAHIMEFMPYFRFDGDVSNNTISQVLSNEVAIELVNHNELDHLSNFTTANLNKIRSCVIKGGNKMRTIVEGNMGGNSILNNLEQLHMINLPVLKNISGGPMQGLTSLKTLILCNCPMLASVCTYGVILQLPNICHLEVEGCYGIKEIFNGSPNVMSPMLPNLNELILVDMPQLISILVSNSFEWPSLEKLKIIGCPKLKRLPFKKDVAVNLISIEAETSWWDALENDQDVKDQFQSYCTLS